MSVGVFVLLEQSLIDVEDEVHFLDLGLEFAQIISGERHMLVAQLMCLNHICLLLGRKTVHSHVEPIECLLIFTESMFVELD